MSRGGVEWCGLEAIVEVNGECGMRRKMAIDIDYRAVGWELQLEKVAVGGQAESFAGGIVDVAPADVTDGCGGGQRSVEDGWDGIGCRPDGRSIG